MRSLSHHELLISDILRRIASLEASINSLTWKVAILAGAASAAGSVAVNVIMK